MARIVYALSGQGRGHGSRVEAMTEELRRRGHTVTFACGGPARARLVARGEAVTPVPALVQRFRGNHLDIAATAFANARAVLGGVRVVRETAAALDALAPDLVVSDFEAFVPRAARRLGLPVVSLCRQEVLTETRYRLPPEQRMGALFISAVVGTLVPRRGIARRIVTTLADAPLRHPERAGKGGAPGGAVLVGPIFRDAVLAARPSVGEHVVAYLNVSRGLDATLAALAASGVPVRLYGVSPSDTAVRARSLAFCAPGDDDAFLADLASARAVVSTAGFTLLSECLHLGKPVLTLPNGGIFEQTFNALQLERVGAGRAIHDRPPTSEDVRMFRRDRDTFSPDGAALLKPGRDAAADEIEACLARPSTRATPRLP